MRSLITSITLVSSLCALVLAEPSKRTHYIDNSCVNMKEYELTYGQMRGLMQLTLDILKLDPVPDDILRLAEDLYGWSWVDPPWVPDRWKITGTHQIACLRRYTTETLPRSSRRHIVVGRS
jgi:hypothetical protein